MSHNLWTVVIMFAIVDLVAVSVIVRRRLEQSGIRLSTLRAISRQVHEQVGAYLPGNYSGRTQDLPPLIEALLPIAAKIAVDRGQMLDQNTLELLVVTSLAAHHVATRPEVNAALRELHEGLGMQRAA